MILLDGKKVRDQIQNDLRHKIAHQISLGFVRPKAVIIQVGDNKESSLFIRNKKKFGENIDAEVTHLHLPENCTEDELLKEIEVLNLDKSVHGIILQLPLPSHIRKDICIESIDPCKDIDGLHSKNVKALWVHQKGIIPATTRGIVTLLNEYNIQIEGKAVAVVGRSHLVGKPTFHALLNQNATVTLCHSKTPNLSFYTSSADILIVAAGLPRLIKQDYVRPGQVVIDVGITVEELPEKRTVGDVDFDAVKDIVDAISPVPGGVGPMTVASLFQNLFDVYLDVLQDGIK